MFKVQELRELIRLVDQSSINEFTYENEGTTITLKKNGGVTVVPEVQQAVEKVVQAPVAEALQPKVEQNTQPAPAPSPAAEKTEPPAEKTEDQSNLHKIESPMVGTFYAASSPDKPPYVKVGDKVEEETIVCIVEAMKLFNEIEAEVKGEIVEVLVENGQLVEYGQPLFLVKPE